MSMNRKQWFDNQSLEVRRSYITVKRNYFASQSALVFAALFLFYIGTGFLVTLPYYEYLKAAWPAVAVFGVIGFLGKRANHVRFINFCEQQKLGKNECAEIMNFDWLE